jgi:hypothetical protein
MRHILKIVLLLLCAPAFATTYYISSGIGDDTANGTSESTPWAHAPGMTGCASACAAYTPVAGDQFILRGGDTWTTSGTANWWIWTWNGSSGSTIQIGGLDQTWYAGGSWTRPIITGAGTWPGSIMKYFLQMSGTYTRVSNIEWTGLYWGVNLTGGIGYISKYTSTAGHFTTDNNYFHGWSHAPGVLEDGYDNAITCESGGVFDSTSSVYLNVFDGTDTDQASFGGIYGPGCNVVYENYFAYIADAMNGGFQTIHDNTFFHASQNVYSGSGSHNNVAESNTDAANLTVYNNVIIHVQGGVGIWMGPSSGNTSYRFNNIIADGMPSANNSMCSYALASPGGTCVDFNNTEECGPDAGPPSQACYRMAVGSGQHAGAASLFNHHWITTDASPYTAIDSGAPTPTQTSTLAQSLTTANGQGYTLAQSFVFSPTSGGSTIGAGTNKSALCTTISGVDAAAGTACLSDTTYGVAYNATTHTASFPARTSVLRGSIWDVGAYQFLPTLAPTLPGLSVLQ